MRTINCLALAIALAAISASALAAPADVDTQCKVEAKKTDAKFFPAMALAAIEVRRSVCVRGGNDQGVISAWTAFVESEAKAERVRPYGFPTDKNPLQLVIAGTDADKGTFPAIAVARPGVDALTVDGTPISPDAETCRRAAEAIKPDATCREALQEFEAIYTYAHDMVEKRGAIAFSKNAAALSKEWDEFMTHAHAQTALELAVNSYLYRKHERPVFTSPPDSQLILLHPNFVLENVSAATEGDQTKEAMMVEVIGKNWWRQKAWYVPSGGSLVVLYSDRAQADDVGYGLALHFKGVYTLGYAFHGSDSGVFLSGDLLKLFEDKKKIVNAYQP
jgi:hypothetical protein